MIYHDNEILIYDDRSTASADDLTSDFVAERCTIILYPNSTFLVPFINSFPLAPKKDLPGFFKADMHLGVEQHFSIMKRALPDASDEVINTLIVINEKVKQSLTIKRDLTHLANDDADVIEALDKRMVRSGFAPNCVNSTKTMDTPSSELFIKIPGDSFIRQYIDQYTDAPVPNLFNVMNPYPSPLYRIPKIEEVLSANIQDRPRMIKKLVDGFRKISEGIFPKDTDFYIKNFKDIPLEHVIGDSRNNDIKIQKNEQVYYDALVEFINYHIMLHNKQIHKDFSNEELEVQTKSDFDTGVLPTGLKLYLEKLLSTIITFQYFHTGFFSHMDDLFDDEDSDNTDEGSSSEDSDTTSGSKFYYSNNEDDRLIQSDADVVLIDYLQISALIYGASVYAEAIVKLLRWGDRKPQRLIVGENNPNTFDLFTMRSITSTIDFSTLDPIEFDGRMYIVEGFVKVSVERLGLSEETVAALILNKVYKHPYTGEDCYVWYIISIPDFIEEYKTVKDIVGINYVDGKYIVDNDYRELGEYNHSDLAGYRFLQTSSVSDTLINLAIRNVQSQAYAVLNSDSLYNIKLDKNQTLAESILSAPENDKVGTLYQFWFNEFERSCPIVDSTDLQVILDAYIDVSNETVEAGDISDFAYNTMFDSEGVVDMNKAVYTGEATKLKFINVIINKKNAFAYAVDADRNTIYASLDEVVADPSMPADKPLRHLVEIMTVMSNLYGAGISSKSFFLKEASLSKMTKSIRATAT